MNLAAFCLALALVVLPVRSVFAQTECDTNAFRKHLDEELKQIGPTPSEQEIKIKIDKLKSNLDASSSGWLTNDFNKYDRAITCLRDGNMNAVLQRVLNALVERSTELADLVTPNLYPPADRLTEDDCFSRVSDLNCNTRLAGFMGAAWAARNNKKCGAVLSTTASNKSIKYRAGFVQWWNAHQVPNDKCEPPPTPARCKLAYCWGGENNFQHGIAFRASTEIGSSIGSGFAFKDNSFAGSLSATATLGARLFVYNDKFDLHLGLGIGKLLQTDATDNTNKERPFLISTVGLGFYNGIGNLQLLVPTDFKSTGKGVSITLDAASFQRLLD